MKSTVSAFFGRQVDKLKAKETKALFYALASGILMTMYSTFYKGIKDKMAKSTVLTLRGALQFTAMGIVSLVSEASILPTKENDGGNNNQKAQDGLLTR